MTATAPAAPGQTVIYHGSLEEFHGTATFDGECVPCLDCTDLLDNWAARGNSGTAPTRYVLRLNSSAELRCVRAESFTAVVPDTTLALQSAAAKYFA